MSLDPFQAYCLRVVGRDMALRYADVSKLTGHKPQTLYNARNTGEITPVNPEAKRPVYHWPTVKSYMQAHGMWPDHS